MDVLDQFELIMIESTWTYLKSPYPKLSVLLLDQGS